MDFNRLDQQLRDSLADLRLSNEERDELRQLGSDLAPEQVRFMRNRAFALVRELINDPASAMPALIQGRSGAGGGREETACPVCTSGRSPHWFGVRPK